MKMADAKQKRNEQLKRWLGSETDLEPPVLKKKKTKVKFDDGAVFLAACSSGDTEEVLRMLDRGADINYANVDGLTALHQVTRLAETRKHKTAWTVQTDAQANDKWGFQISSAKLVTEGVAFHVPAVLAPCIPHMTVAGNRGKERAEQTFLSCHLNPSPAAILSPACLSPRYNAKTQLTVAHRAPSRQLVPSVRVLCSSPQGSAVTLNVSESGYHNAFLVLLTLHTLITALKSMNIISRRLHDDDSGKACIDDNVDMVTFLVEHGAGINQPDNEGWIPLHAAASCGYLDIAEYLISQGANVGVVNSEGETPLDIAEEEAMEELLQNEINRQAASRSCNELKVENPTNVSQADSVPGAERVEMKCSKSVLSSTDLNLAYADVPFNRFKNPRGDLKALPECQDMSDDVSSGVDIEAARKEEERVMLRDARQWLNSGQIQDVRHAKSGGTSLHVAAAKGYVEVLKLLIQAGYDVNIKDYDGWTPLHASAHWGKEEACRILVENLCDMDLINKMGQTAFDVADEDVLGYLEELQKKQNLLMSGKKDVKKSPLIETTTTGDNNQSLKPLKSKETLLLEPEKTAPRIETLEPEKVDEEEEGKKDESSCSSEEEEDEDSESENEADKSKPSASVSNNTTPTATGITVSPPTSPTNQVTTPTSPVKKVRPGGRSVYRPTLRGESRDAAI
ncbi:Protein phosphatase 1 regulatory subunit 12A [Collichthys lucidus]|uniref:Protein phosphatase 1 regulatory subunit 12A n=1 Tax=Collichthys lucidus TaxID=240159 RepID=A0A4V6AT16_COLLU|nr:Protein phosphatase 1 regulatory subunit 12A [Collichthys lucidus]